jgi:predicted membrane-bound spermidine synthase
MNQFTRRILFLLFFLSGFCSLAYQVVWTRIAFASFGIITPVLSVVLSVFMLGLAAGSWAGGRYIASLVEKTGLSAVVFYAVAEFLIGLGAFAVPKLFAAGEHFLLAAGQTNSIGYLSLSALVLAFSILPWYLFMGKTFPLMMAYIRERDSKNTELSVFSIWPMCLGR